MPSAGCPSAPCSPCNAEHLPPQTMFCYTCSTCRRCMSCAKLAYDGHEPQHQEGIHSCFTVTHAKSTSCVCMCSVFLIVSHAKATRLDVCLQPRTAQLQSMMWTSPPKQEGCASLPCITWQAQLPYPQGPGPLPWPSPRPCPISHKAALTHCC